MRKVNPTRVYNSAFAGIAERFRIDEAVSAILWALRNNAEDFPVIPGYKTLRMATTDAIREIPSLHVVFKIPDKDNVTLEWIEIAESDEFQGPPLM